MTSIERINLGTKVVRLGIQHKDLLPLDFQKCAGGCGRRAEQYHHFAGYEDWQLLDVIPVCRFCHSLADRIRNGEDVNQNLPGVQNILAAIKRERRQHRKRRLYLMEDFQNTEYPYRWLISSVGKPPAVIVTDMDWSTFRFYLYSRQIKRVDISIECVLCGSPHRLPRPIGCLAPGEVSDPCSCPCHKRMSVNRSGEKYCVYCECILPLSKFWKDKSKPDGYSKHCAQCGSRRKRGEHGFWGTRLDGTIGYIVLIPARPLKVIRNR